MKVKFTMVSAVPGLDSNENIMVKLLYLIFLYEEVI